MTLAGCTFCWGFNRDGELGDGTTTNHLRPVLVDNGLVWAQVSARLEHTCGVTRDDRAYCWGSSFSGQLGDGTTTDRLTPVPVAGAM